MSALTHHCTRPFGRPPSSTAMVSPELRHPVAASRIESPTSLEPPRPPGSASTPRFIRVLVDLVGPRPQPLPPSAPAASAPSSRSRPRAQPKFAGSNPAGVSTAVTVSSTAASGFRSLTPRRHRQSHRDSGSSTAAPFLKTAPFGSRAETPRGERRRFELRAAFEDPADPSVSVPPLRAPSHLFEIESPSARAPPLRLAEPLRDSAADVLSSAARRRQTPRAVTPELRLEPRCADLEH